MIPADEIYHILKDLKKLRQERGYTKSGFDGVNKRILALAKDYYWRKDELIGLIEEKERFFDYKIVHKEIKVMKSLLKYINKLMKKKEFVAELDDIEQFKKAIRFNELKLKALDGRNKECRSKKRIFEKIIKMKNGEFEKYLNEWDSAQAKIAYVDRLEDGLERKVMIEQARKFPESVRRKSGVWKTATAYAVAAMIGFGVATADYKAGEGISFGGGEAVAGEVQQKKIPWAAQEYNWDYVSTILHDINKPDGSGRSWRIDKNTWKDLFENNKSIRNIFKDSKTMSKVMNILLDNHKYNDEIFTISINKKFIGFYIITKDNFIKAPKRITGEDGLSVYSVFERINSQQFKNLLSYSK